MNKSTKEEGPRNVGEFGESGNFGDISPRLLAKCYEQINHFRKKGPEMLLKTANSAKVSFREISPRLLSKCYERINRFRKGPEMLANLAKTGNLAKVAILAKFRQGC